MGKLFASKLNTEQRESKTPAFQVKNIAVGAMVHLIQIETMAGISRKAVKSYADDIAGVLNVEPGLIRFANHPRLGYCIEVPRAAADYWRTVLF